MLVWIGIFVLHVIWKCSADLEIYIRLREVCWLLD